MFSNLNIQKKCQIKVYIQQRQRVESLRNRFKHSFQNFVVDFSFSVLVSSLVFVFIIEKNANLVSLHMRSSHSNILLLIYLLLLTARFGKIVASSCELSYILTANYYKDTIVLRDKTTDTSLQNVTILLHNAMIQGKRNIVHNNRCV